MPRSFAVAAVALFALAACDTSKYAADPSRQSVWRDDITHEVERRIKLDVNKASHVVQVANGRLATGEAGRLGAFLAAQGAPWSMDVRLQPLTPAGEKAVREVGEIVARLGVQPGRVLIAGPGGRELEGDLVIDIRNVRARASGCPDWRRSNMMDISELNTSNFGCATADNLARMIADPRELRSGRALDPAHGDQAARGVQRYRNDQVKPLIERDASGGAGGGGGSD